MSAQQLPPQSSMAITLQIVSIVFYTFIAFLCIGLPIAVLSVTGLGLTLLLKRRAMT